MIKNNLHLGHPEYTAYRIIIEIRDKEKGDNPPKNFDPNSSKTAWRFIGICFSAMALVLLSTSCLN